MGNESIARGAIESGIQGVFAYPGTPSTEISEIFNHVSQFQNNPDYIAKHPELTANPIYFEFSVNEKVAVEKGIAYSLGNKKAMCVMKSAGMNVAADPLMTIPYQVIGKALVIVICDDPGCYSSSNEQDSRCWGKMASVPVFNPATPQDAKNMVKDAFALSEMLKLPVIVRSTTRVSHSRGIVTFGKISLPDNEARFDKLPAHLNIPARTAKAHKLLLEKMDDELFTPFHEMNNVVYSFNGALDEKTSPKSLAIIASGVAAADALEIINNNQIFTDIDLLKIGIIHPFPAGIVNDFLSRGYRKLLILEELEPIVEDEIRNLAQRHKLDVEIIGKGFAGLSRAGEYNISIVSKAIEKFTAHPVKRKAPLPAADIKRFMQSLPPRPPALCPGCPHRAAFYALKLVLGADASETVLCGDIGCFALGAMPPYLLIDTIHHMGMSASMAQGLSEALAASRTAKQKIIALCGDGTVFHSGISSILNAVYTKANITLIVFDNRTIGMTGHQYNPGSEQLELTEQVDLAALLKGLGVGFVKTVDPNDLGKCAAAIAAAIDHQGMAVVVAQSPCVFLREFRDAGASKSKVQVDPNLCNVCHNQDDPLIQCSREYSAATDFAKARAKVLAKNHIPAGEQLCPANICNHGFYNALLANRYDEALNIVRDKMIFAHVCGEICPKPCEFMFAKDGKATIPIRRLKHFVAENAGNAWDFSVQIERMASVEKKNKNIAVIGAGPAGLSAAYDLIRTGYGVTVFEKEKTAGGLLKSAIPGFRIDKEACDREIGILNDLGVDFRFNTALGRDVQVDKLAEDFDAVIIAVGMAISTALDEIEKNVPARNRFQAIDFLWEYNRQSLDVETNSTIFVIGGGNSAIDAARAAKHYGVRDVQIIYRRNREEMPAFEEDVEAALSEGVEIRHNVVIDSCHSNSSGKIDVSLKAFKGDESFGETQCDYIISAIGQKGDGAILNGDGIETDWNDRIIAGVETGGTKHENVFVAGDICADNHVSVIGAIASGKKAAAGVRKLLEGYAYPYEGNKALSILSEHNRMKSEYNRSEDSVVDEASIANLVAEFDLYQGCGKCNHCIENFGCPALLKIDGKAVIDDFQCTRCGLCIDVCLNNAISYV